MDLTLTSTNAKVYMPLLQVTGLQGRAGALTGEKPKSSSQGPSLFSALLSEGRVCDDHLIHTQGEESRERAEEMDLARVFRIDPVRCQLRTKLASFYLCSLEISEYL